MSLVSIQTPAFISYCLSVQGRMAGASISVYELIAWLEANTCIKLHRVHSQTKHVSTSVLQEDNERDKYAVNDQL